MRSFLFALFFVAPFLSSFAQSIHGTAASFYAGKPAYLYFYSDAVSRHKQLADSCTVKPDGSFEFNFKTDHTTEAVISIDRVNGSIYLETASKYKVFFAALDAGQTKTMNNSNLINLEFENLPKTDLNALIASFNQEFDGFFDSQLSNVFDRSFHKSLQTFHQSCDSTYAVYKNSFLNQYIHFCFANFELNSGTYRKVLFEKYLQNHKLDLHNPEFGNFVTQFFAGELERFDRFSKNKPLSTAISKGNATEFLESLRNNDFLKNNEQLREIAALVIFTEEFRKKGAGKSNLIKMIDDVARLSSLASIKSLAHQVKAELTRNQPGYPAYHFKLKTNDNRLVKLETFAGKPTVLMFTTGRSKDSNLEMNLMKGLFQKYGKQINFLIIGVNDNEEEFAKNFTNGNGYPLSVSYSSDKFIIEQMDISYLPQFILLDKAGNYLKYPAPAPSAGLEAELLNLLPKN